MIMKNVFIFLTCLSFTVFGASIPTISENGKYILQLNQTTCIKHFVPQFLASVISSLNQTHTIKNNQRIIKRATNEEQVHIFDAYDLGTSFKAIGVRLNKDILHLIKKNQDILEIVPDYSIKFDSPISTNNNKSKDKRYYIRTSGIAATGAIRNDLFQLDDWEHDINCPFAKPINETRQFNITQAKINTTTTAATAADVPSKISYKQEINAQWNLIRISEKDIDFTRPYTYDSEAGSDVNVYVLDDGMNTKHQQFGGRASWGWSAYSNISKLGEGHGTHVAGIIGGSTYGVAKKTHLIAVQILNSNGEGTISDIIAGIQWTKTHATKNKRRGIINMSLGIKDNNDDPALKALKNALAATVKEAGIPIIVAAGNWEMDACKVLPAGDENVFAVGASDIKDGFASFSDHGKCVQLIAPGENIKSAFIDSNTSTKILSGTSMAAPHVSGAAALLLSKDPLLKPNELYKKLTGAASKNKIKSIKGDTPNLLLYSGRN